MPVDMAALTADLAAEWAELDGVLAGLDDAGWDRPTPAVGWSVRDQVTHLAYFDEAAVTSAVDPERFRAELDRLGTAEDGLPDRVAAEHRGMPPAEVLAWARRARAEYVRVFAGLDPGTRLPWYGPPMGAASSVTARLMETWAHGQDVLDALGRTRVPSARLRHIAHLGVRTLGYSFRVHGRPEPTVPVRLELAAPDGGSWTWGPEDAADRVSGPAEDFCLLVTRRRSRAQTAVVAEGPVAEEWLAVAQAYAGPPGPGRG
ncbi:TIGR03084 family metal-binding protein [Blastococcus sp. SYSU D00820]